MCVHVPKTGGSSISEILAPWVNPDASTEERHGWQWAFHRGGMHAGISGDFADYFEFALVRNPYDRVMSWWRDRGEAFGRRRPLRSMVSITGGLDHIARYENYEQEVRTIFEGLGVTLESVPHRARREKSGAPDHRAEAGDIYRQYREHFGRFEYAEDSWRTL